MTSDHVKRWLLRFITLSHFIYFVCFFFSSCDIICLSWRWERGLQPSSNNVKNQSCGFDICHRGSLSLSSQVQRWLLRGNTGNISVTVRGEARRNILSMDMHYPVDNRWTDSPAHRLAGPREDGQTMKAKRWNSPLLRVQEKDMTLILAWWHMTCQPLGC